MGDERRYGARAPIGRTVATQNQIRLAHRADRRDQRLRQAAPVIGQVANPGILIGTPAGGPRHSHHRRADGACLPQGRLRRYRPGRHGEHLSTPGLGNAQGSLQARQLGRVGSS